MSTKNKKLILWFNEISMKDTALVGGKNASLGEMYQSLTPKGIRIPNGFAVTAYAFRRFLKYNNLENEIKDLIQTINPESVVDLNEKAAKIRKIILKSQLPVDLVKAVNEAYLQLTRNSSADVAVRSSATAEDLPLASFAGQLESFLNIRGTGLLLKAIKKCFASLYTARAIAYSFEHGFDHTKIFVSVCVQKMVRSDRASAGVMFTLDTETGFRNVVLINSAWGLGENVVKGRINADQFYVFKPTLLLGFKPIIGKFLGTKKLKLVYKKTSKKTDRQTTQNLKTSKEEQLKYSLSDEEILELAKWAVLIENHYQKPMDIEWAKDGLDKKIYILQARPETVHASRFGKILEYSLERKSEVLLRGIAIGTKIGRGWVRKLENVREIDKFKEGEVLVTYATDPDWVPIMKKASAIITESGGRTCFTGDTLLFTNLGFLTMEEVVERCGSEKIYTISLNRESLKIEWKQITTGMVRIAEPIKITVSQTGKMQGNEIGVTPDHKFLVFDKRKLISKEIEKLLQTKEAVLSISRISGFNLGNYLPLPNVVVDFDKVRNKTLNKDFGYFLGGISTDGSIYLSRTHGETQFIQKPTKEKIAFIKKMNLCLKNLFNYSFHQSIKKESTGLIRGKKAIGSAVAYRCYSKSIVPCVLNAQKNLVFYLMKGDPEFNYSFLAGVIDGDGTFNLKTGRIHIFCSREDLLQAIVVACLKLNISFQVSKNRTIYNVQITDGIDDIFKFTARVKGFARSRKFGTRFFLARSLLEDIKEKVNFQGKILPYIDKNLLIDKIKIQNRVIPLIKGSIYNHELTKIINSDLKALRVSFVAKLPPQKVYNITVEGNHNYVVFTKRYTPLIVENCHAAIVSRELGIPCIVGAIDARKVLKSGQGVTVSCAEGEEGKVYQGFLPIKVKKIDVEKIKRPKRTKIMMNVGEPDRAFSFSFIPNDGVGLAREEFIISNYIKIHPLALLAKKLSDKKAEKQIKELTFNYKNKVKFFVDKLAEGIGKIAAAFYPKPVIVRFSDFKSNEYAGLIGGENFEPKEANPMLGWRGASRYYDPKYQRAFLLECEAINKVHKEFGLDNIIVMIPFCRTVEEGKKVIKIVEKSGLKISNYKFQIPKLKPLKIYMMVEIPSNIILADKFAKIFDGFSIGSNDLTQLILGVDRDSELVSHLFDERNEAVTKPIKELIKIAHKNKIKVGICGQAPSDFPDFAAFLVKCGIDSISLNPDTVLKTTLKVLEIEKKMKKKT
jgi:pyruvate,water dikinase